MNLDKPSNHIVLLIILSSLVLEQTPQLDVKMDPISLQNSTLIANLTVSVLSSRIPTIYPIQIQLIDGFLLDEIQSISADSYIVEVIHLEFTDLELSSNTPIQVGNEFSGYYRFIVYFIVGVNYIPLLFGGSIITVLAIVVIFVTIRRK